MTLPTGTAEFDIARSGKLVYVAGGGAAASPRTLAWVDRQGREGRSRSYQSVRPRCTALAGWDASGTRNQDQLNDIWVWDFARHILTRVTTDPGLDESPVWMPDGRRLVFTSQAGGALGSLFWQAADGTGVAERLTNGKLIQRASAVLADGTKVLFSEGGDF